ncbi:hypothetical protein BKA59DRAFT_509494 [Fusarium tricinctum]|uniref:Transmembrane protein n=1 Tax=Fusarium tricinctum TaxID=61284 RepID=A0A8K0RYU4_9HYPO|nr:hypothetical protein BKA59DRAFT_509494 [Fusarium tricinctum]
MDPTTDTATCRERETKSNSNHEQEPINMSLNSAETASALPTNQDPRDMHPLRDAALIFWTAALLAIALPMCLVDWTDVDDAGIGSRFWIHIVLAQFVALTIGLWWCLGSYCH